VEDESNGSSIKEGTWTGRRSRDIEGEGRAAKTSEMGQL